MRASALLDAYLSGYPQVKNLSHRLPVFRILQIIPMMLQVGAAGLFFAIPFIGAPGGVMAAIGCGLIIAIIGLYLSSHSAFNPIERLVLTEHSIFVKRIRSNDIILRHHIRGMKFVPPSNQDYDDLQQHGRLLETTIRARGKRVRVNCRLLITESDVDKLSRWLFGDREVETVVPAALENGAKGGGD
jgi:hypothetical protein